MDRNYYYQKRAQERQREISQELANRHLLREARSNTSAIKRVKRIVLRIVPAAIVFITLSCSISSASGCQPPNQDARACRDASRFSSKQAHVKPASRQSLMRVLF